MRVLLLIIASFLLLFIVFTSIPEKEEKTYPPIIVSFEEGWYGFEHTGDNKEMSWVNGTEGTIALYGTKNDTLIIQWQVNSFVFPRTVEIYQNDQLLSTKKIFRWQTIRLPITFHEEIEHILFRTTEKCVTPNSIIPFSDDTRCLSIGVTIPEGYEP